MHALGHALGGEAAARLANAFGLRTSADTVLRELRRASGRKRKPRPRVVGIDDWAIARGHQYGTIIVDLERREPIAVFAGREATAVTAWMRAHRSIEIVARDRAGAYSEAVDIALPAARQVSDRWHLLCNLRDNVERLLCRLGPRLLQIVNRRAQRLCHRPALDISGLSAMAVAFLLSLRTKAKVPFRTQCA
ncbi:transposase [Cupriavidus sp. SK-4]|uniref:transposase n=1 Tax=Cupriavidus sp. SK-4 TaxID=574750 RepID=UPI000452C81B|nr:transposase [Cupriavidus sp. SK-4]EYS86315.1 transposase [Cupriavidus sp. SK-4]